MTKFSFLRESPIVPDWSSPAAQAERRQLQDEDEPENLRIVDGVEYMTVAEYLRHVDPIFYPSVDVLVSASGTDRTYQVLGKTAAEHGRIMGVAPVKLFHPDYETVNGWPLRVLDAAWSRFKLDYRIQWRERDEVKPKVPEPVRMPPPEYNPRLYDQIRAAAARRGINYPVTRDPRWRGAFAVMLDEREGETPQQALIRRNSAAAAMFAIEMEYAKEGR